MKNRPKNLKQAFMIESVDTDSDSALDADELRSLADDLEGEAITGQELRDALISNISDMHKDIYHKRPNAHDLRLMSTEELEREHDKITQAHKDWWYEERHREDQDMWSDQESTDIESLMEPEEGEDMHKQIGMGRGKMSEMTRTMLRQIIDEEFNKLTEGEVVDLFPKGKPGPQDKEALAKAMAARAEELLDLDGDGNDIEVRVEPDLFMQPYIDVDGHGNEVPSLVDHVYNNYVMGMAGDHAEKLDDIIERIGIDYFDQDIEYALKALGDDRFDGTQDQMMTSPVSGDSDEDWIYDLEGEMEDKMQGIESGDVVELEPDDDLAENKLNEGVMEDRWSRIAGLDRLNEQASEQDD
tara:strand:+ start:2728 stop:3795 length:1068 start_codon:yes stop_codon:yes gene_type:complete